MPTLIQDIENHLKAILGARRAVDVSDVIQQYDSNQVKLTKFLMLLPGKQKPLKNMEFSWWEDDVNPRSDPIASTVNATAVSMTVTDSTKFRIGDVLFVPKVSGEIMLITAINGTTHALTISRSVGTTAASGYVPADVVFITSGERAESSGTRPMLTTKVDQISNFAQIFEQTYGTSIIANATQLYGTSNEHGRLQAKHYAELQFDKEYAFLYQQPAEIATGTYYEWITGGTQYFSYLRDTASANTLAAGAGPVSESAFDDFLEAVFRYGSSKKLVIAGGRLMNDLNTDIAKKNIRTFSGDTRYGIGLKDYINPYGDCKILYHPLMRGPLEYYHFILDIGHIKYRFLPGFKDTLFTEIQTPGTKKLIDTYVSVSGMEQSLIKAHGCIYYNAAEA